MIKDKGSGNTIRPSQNTFDIKDLEAKTNTELLAAMDEMLARPVEEVDGDFVDACLNILQDRVPVAENYDPQAMMNRVREAIFEVEENSTTKAMPKKRGPLFRYGGVFAAAMLCLVVTANAFGYNPIQTVFRWFNDTIQVFSNPSGLMELPADTPSEYHSLEEALEACGASTANRITWIPKDYSIVKVRVTSSENFLLVTAMYESERGEITIRLIDAKGADLHGVIESDLGGSVYAKDETAYYITSNYDFTVASWNDGKYSYEISGQISENEMKGILDSIT